MEVITEFLTKNRKGTFYLVNPARVLSNELYKKESELTMFYIFIFVLSRHSFLKYALIEYNEWIDLIKEKMGPIKMDLKKIFLGGKKV